MHAVRRAAAVGARRACSTRAGGSNPADQGPPKEWLKSKAQEWRDGPGEAPELKAGAKSLNAALEEEQQERIMRQEAAQNEKIRVVARGEKIKPKGKNADYWKAANKGAEDDEEELTVAGELQPGEVPEDFTDTVDPKVKAAVGQHKAGLEATRRRHDVTPEQKEAIQAKRAAREASAEQAVEEEEDEMRITQDDVTAEVQALAEEVRLKPGIEIELSGVYEENKYCFTVTEDNYDETVENEPLPVILDCWAPQCADSIALTATLKLFVGAVNTNGIKLKLGHLDCNTNYSLTLHIGVNSLPTTLAVKESEVLEQINGMLDEESIAQFVFGYIQYVYGEEALSHITEEHPLARLVDARVALKVKDYQASLDKYTDLFLEMLPVYEKECAERQRQADAGEAFHPDRARTVSEAEVIAAKALMGMATCCYHRKQDRQCRKILKELKQTFPKIFKTFADIRKTTATLEILMLTGFRVEDNTDVEDMEDEERIDQHNLDLKLKLIGAYFIAGEMHKAMSTTFILIRKNRYYKDEVGYMVLCRLMMYLGRHHPIREEYDGLFQELLRLPLARTYSDSKKLCIALNEPGGWNPLEHEVPLMVDRSSFVNELNITRHPLLR